MHKFKETEAKMKW